MFTLRAAVMWTVNDFLIYAMDKKFDGNTEHRLRPKEWSGDEILEQLNRLDFSSFGKTVTRTRPSTHLNLTHKPMFFELPYWLKLKLRHNLDVMHVEKNVFDTLIGTILDIEGLKSHDCHVFMQRLLPMGIRHFLPEDVVKPIMLLSRFFSQLMAKTLQKTDINQLRHDIVQVLCKFEMIFSPAFFTSMIHVMFHLTEEALLAGPIERLLGELKKTVHNMAKPKGSIIEASVEYESLTFCGIGALGPSAIPNLSERVGVLGFEFGYHLSLEWISPIVRFPDLIRRRRSVKNAPSSEPLAQPASAATAPALMDHVPVGLGGS
ncbi:hypothetical protein L3X38_017582 [Prunus dulcis]|uniref:DUF4218 domain-containing protein n=1 Tax=Prunus dulcis TaxID=3755 RepID=A0AAD4W9Z7_PRUDU|nr:hypothetical protein L3X38_017582 [Prunus dulcis]